MHIPFAFPFSIRVYNFIWNKITRIWTMRNAISDSTIVNIMSDDGYQELFRYVPIQVSWMKAEYSY